MFIEAMSAIPRDPPLQSLSVMPRKSAPTHPLGKRLVQLRAERGLTQTDLAELIGSSQRNISHYETVAEAPPANVLVKLAKVLEVSTDELLGLRPPKNTAPAQDAETKRLWKKFQQVRSLPVKDQRAVIRLINSLVSTKQAS
jgi:transcriptional regulator with XRE-family HTH domain